MDSDRRSGQAGFAFKYCEDLRNLPPKTLVFEEKLHGGFAIDRRPDHGHIYYGMPGCGLLRGSPDLTRQELLELPSDLTSINFHSTKIGEFDGQPRLFLPANGDAMVAVVSLEGEVDFILPRPEFDEYSETSTPFNPTDTVQNGDRLLVADGYGANYISTADLATRQWTSLFGGKTDSLDEHGKFGTAHGLNPTPTGDHLAIADRPHSRFEICTLEGEFVSSHPIPSGSRPCGIDFIQRGDRWYAAVASLDDPDEGRPAPIYILDAATYEVLSTIRPKEDLGIERADHMHNVIWYERDGQLFLICQSWNPGYYFVLEHLA